MTTSTDFKRGYDAASRAKQRIIDALEQQNTGLRAALEECSKVVNSGHHYHAIFDAVNVVTTNALANPAAAPTTTAASVSHPASKR